MSLLKRLRACQSGIVARRLAQARTYSINKNGNKNGWQDAACQPSKHLTLPLGRNHEATQDQLLATLDAKVILHREDAGNSIGRDERARRVAFIRRDAF